MQKYQLSKQVYIYRAVTRLLLTNECICLPLVLSQSERVDSFRDNSHNTKWEETFNCWRCLLHCSSRIIPTRFGISQEELLSAEHVEVTAAKELSVVREKLQQKEDFANKVSESLSALEQENNELQDR